MTKNIEEWIHHLEFGTFPINSEYIYDWDIIKHTDYFMKENSHKIEENLILVNTKVFPNLKSLKKFYFEHGTKILQSVSLKIKNGKPLFILAQGIKHK